VGPATSLQAQSSVKDWQKREVKTEGQAIAELGRRLASLVLTQQQWSLLQTNLPRVCICGLWGTGEWTCENVCVCVCVYVCVCGGGGREVGEGVDQCEPDQPSLECG
jgi:hypothetical protein